MYFCRNNLNQLIEYMELLKKDSGRLAIWNLVAPFGFLGIGLILVMSMSYFKPQEVMAILAGIGALFEVPLFIFFFLYWFKFLIGINRCYKDNAKLMYADIIGWIAISLRLLMSFIGLMLVIFVVFIKSNHYVSIQFLPSGMYLQGPILQVSHTVYLIISVLFCVMYLLFMLASERKTAVRTLSLIIVIVQGSLAFFPMLFPTLPWIILEIALAVTTLMFFWEIHRGYVFPSPSKQQELPE